jgi:hypothetical protein
MTADGKHVRSGYKSNYHNAALNAAEYAAY